VSATETVSPELQELLDKQELEEVVIRYCRAIDRRDEDLLLSCFHPDAYIDHGPCKGTPAEYLEYLRSRSMSETAGPRLHRGTNCLFEVDGDTAYGEAYKHVLEFAPDGGRIHGYSRYIRRFERRQGAWRIARQVAILEWTNNPSRRVGSTGWAEGSR